MLTKNEKSWGGYSTSSLPTRNADTSLESTDKISFLLDIYQDIEKSDSLHGEAIVNALMKKDFKKALNLAKNPNTIKFITTAIELNSNSNKLRLAKNELVNKIITIDLKNQIHFYDPMNDSIVLAHLNKGKFEDAFNSTDNEQVKELISTIKTQYEKEIKNLKRLLEK
jgi:hypothetical protein